MTLGGYAVKQSSVDRNRSWFFAERDGGAYIVQPCGQGFDARRRVTIQWVLQSAILPESNLSVPDIFEADGSWYSADLLTETELWDLPIAAMGALGPGHQRRLVLSAVSALAALERAGIVHGNIAPRNLRIQRARDGSLCVRLIGLARAGIVGVMLPQRGGNPGYADENPEMDVTRLRSTEDVFALGACLHLWFSNDFPVALGGDGRESFLLSDRIPPALLPVIGIMLAPKPENRPLPSALMRILESILRLRTAQTYRTYPDPEDSAEYRQLIQDAIRQQDPAFDPKFMEEDARRMHWAG